MQPPLAVEVSLDVFICVAAADGRIEDPSRVRDLFIRAPRESANDIEIINKAKLEHDHTRIRTVL